MGICKQVLEFMEHFGLQYDGPPRLLSADEQDFRINCLHEELEEYEAAVLSKDAEEQLDALIDLVYFAIGTAYRNGWDFQKAFGKVHASNMLKEINPANQRRGFHLEVTKPTGWVSPDLYDFVDGNISGVYKPNQLKGKYKGLVTVDGPDASGKTTLANRIAEITGGECIHLTWSKDLDRVMDDYRTAAIQYAAALAQDRVVVLERPWLSHPIYSSVYRCDRVHNWAKWRDLVFSKNALQVLALPGQKGLWFENYVRMTKTRQELYSLEDNMKMGDVYDGFTHFQESGELNYMVCYDMQSNRNQTHMDNWIKLNVLDELLNVLD